MFDAKELPKADFSLAQISLEAQKMAGKLSISGVQPKLSVMWDKKKNLLVPVAERGAYILKPQTQSFPNIPENEQCCMDMAQMLGIDIPAHSLVPLKDGSLSYVVARFDRKGRKKIHQEDFAQILGRDDKYKGSVEEIGRVLKQVSSVPGLDVQLFFERVVFNFLIGNGDAHLKNYSIFYINENEARLTPAYDLVSSKLVIPGEEDSALVINGKKNRLSGQDFQDLARYLNIPQKIRYEKFDRKLNAMNETIRNSKLDKEKQVGFMDIIQERFRRMGLQG
jgi:serine/threonine-protein kinase HipA